MTRETETNKEFRDRLKAEGREIPTRHQHLMSQTTSQARRAKEIRRYNEASKRVEAKVQKEIEDIVSSTPSFMEKQRSYDRARGAYDPVKPADPESLMTHSVVPRRREALEVDA